MNYDGSHSNLSAYLQRDEEKTSIEAFAVEAHEEMPPSHTLQQSFR